MSFVKISDDLMLNPELVISLHGVYGEKGDMVNESCIYAAEGLNRNIQKSYSAALECLKEFLVEIGPKCAVNPRYVLSISCDFNSKTFETFVVVNTTCGGPALKSPLSFDRVCELINGGL